jgi:hypothetical protein
VFQNIIPTKCDLNQSQIKMPTFDVDIADKTYEVDAPDERTAWAWANRSHQDEQNKGKKAVDDEVASMRQGSALKRGARGAGASLQNLGYGLKGIVSDLTPEQQQTVDVNKRFLDEDTAGFVGGLATDVASFAVPGGAALKVARALPAAMRLARAAPLLAPLAANTALDTGLAAAYAPEDRGEAALAGAAGSVAGQGLARAAGRVLGGVFTPSDAARRLMDRGIQPTVGQSVGGLANRTEQAIAGIPIVGGPINRARTRTAEDILRSGADISDRNIAPYRNMPGRVVAGLNELPNNATGNELLNVVNSNASAIYTDALNLVGNVNMSNAPAALTALATRSAAGNAVEPRLLTNFIDEIITPNIQGGMIHGQQWKFVDSELGNIAASFRAGGERQNRPLANAFTDLQTWWRTDLASKVPPELTGQINAANAAWRQMLPLEQAASYSGARGRGGLPSGNELQRAVAQLDRSRFDRGSRYNADEMARLANDANSVTGNVLGDSGTALRMAAMGATGATAAFMNAVPQLAASRAATQIGYLRPVQRALLGGYGRQRAMQDALRRLSPYAGDIGASFSE